MRESRNLEYKQEINNSFLKTVSAFANYGEGKIVFGINDNGEIVGVKQLDETLLKIENKINDSIKPNPNYKIDVDKKNEIITLTIEEGLFKPYYYNSKAYKRNDTSTIEVDRIELNRLVLEGNNQTFEELIAKNQNLEFSILEKELKDKLSIHAVSSDILKTLELYNESKGYNNAGELISDHNHFSGMDIVLFGESIDIIKDREILTGISIIQMYHRSIDLFNQYYTYEEINGSDRKKKELISEKAFREAVANALVHRAWDVKANIQIAMYDNRIEIVSPGGLYGGLSKDNYLKGMISILRNPIIGNIFFRFNYIEKFGTGIKRILNAYSNNKISPQFEIDANFIKITLPILLEQLDLTKDEEHIYGLISNLKMSSGEIVAKSDFGRSKTLNILKKLVEETYIQTSGNGRGKKYFNQTRTPFPKA